MPLFLNNEIVQCEKNNINTLRTFIIYLWTFRDINALMFPYSSSPQLTSA